MHLDFLIEDVSGKIMLEILLPKVLPAGVSYTIYSYKGVGRIPGKMHSAKAIKGKQLLDNLPRLLNGFGRTYHNWGESYKGHVVVIFDLDDKSLDEFLAQLHQLLEWCQVAPETSFCMAIEEGEAWFLGDANALFKAYPHAKRQVLKTYKQDSICGTWEKLADVVGYDYRDKSYQEVGLKKREWAEKITPYMEAENNQSPSFQYLMDELKRIV